MDLPVGVSTLQHTDRWINAPLCAILTFVRRIVEAAGPPGPRQVRPVLFIKFAEQGSTVLSRNSPRHGNGRTRERLLYRVRRQPVHPRRNGNHSRGKCDHDPDHQPMGARGRRIAP